MRKSGVTRNVEGSVRELLRYMGEDPRREGLEKTPARVAKMYEFLTKGYHEEVETVLNKAVFTERYSEMVIVRDINFFSLCEHHLVPFYGKCHIAYIPNGKIIGLSKLPRIVEMFARRLQVQERLTQQIADTLYKHLKPLGVGVVMEARHLCMMMRGVEKHDSIATTSAMLGAFRNDVKTRSEFLTLLDRKMGN
jgi:GTP cyclohydrolase I